MSEEELRGLMRAMWRVTFVLDDQTRLKTIPVNWADYPRSDRAVLIDELRRLCTRDLKRYSPTRFRLEFHGLPSQLLAMLAEIGGQDNADFTWGLIPPPDEPD
jgi:hypothetical protein